MRVEHSPKHYNLSCDSGKFVDRQELVVGLSLIANPSNVFKMASDTDHISKLRQNHRYYASNQFEYRDIVTSELDYVIIVGVPGCGKTTLVETLLYKWAREEIWKDSFDFVFVIYLRKLVRFRETVDVTAEDVLSFFYPSIDFRKIFQSKETKALLVLEGFDELSGKKCLLVGEEEFTSYTRAIYDLLDPRNSRLPFAKIVTSRPGSCPILFESDLFASHKQKVFQITGFSQKSIECYIRNHFVATESFNCAETVLTKLRELPMVFEMMTIPFYCWGVCYLISSNIPVDDFSQTYTELYANLLVVFVLKHGLRKKCRRLVDVLNHPKFKTICFGLAELALKLEEKQQINFTAADLPDGVDIGELVEQSGMIIEIESHDGLMKTYQFLHYTLHEFLVAVNLFINGKFSFVKNKQIQLMLAGLLGGTIEASNSNLIVRKLGSLLSQNGGPRSFEEMMSHHFVDHVAWVFPLLYEYHNKTTIDATLRQEICEKTPHYEQSFKFVLGMCRKKEIRMKRFDLSSKYVDVDIFRLIPFCQCRELVVRDKETMRELMSIISQHSLTFRRISYDGMYWKDILGLLHHTETLELSLWENFDLLLSDLAPQSVRKIITKQFVIYMHIKDFTNLNIERLNALVHSIDVEQIVMAISSKESRGCESRFSLTCNNWTRIYALRSEWNAFCRTHNIQNKLSFGRLRVSNKNKKLTRRVVFSPTESEL